MEELSNEDAEVLVKNKLKLSFEFLHNNSNNY